MADIKVFYKGDKVSIDGSGYATVISYKGRGTYLLSVDGTDYEMELNETRMELSPTSDTVKLSQQTSITSSSSGPPSSSTTENVSASSSNTTRSTTPSSGPGRFVEIEEIEDNDIEKIIHDQENKNTARKTLNDVNLCDKFF